MYNGLKIFKIIPVESDFTAIAITDNPAIEEYFLKFNNEEKMEFSFNDEKQIMYGVAMKPNTYIFRKGINGGEDFYVFYDEEGIQKMATLFLKSGMKMNIEHGDRVIPVDILESYFARENNDFNAPIGSWIIQAKVNNTTDWNDIKSMGFTGFSIQGLFKQQEVDGIQKFNANINKMNLEEIKKAVIDAISNISFSQEAEVVVEESVDEELKTEETFSTEEVIEEKVVEEVKAEEPIAETFSKEQIEEMIEAKFSAYKEEIEALKVKLEEFGNQKLPMDFQSEEAKGDVKSKIEIPAAKYFK